MRVRPNLTNHGDGLGLVFIVGIGIGEQNRHGKTIRIDQLAGGNAHGIQINGGADCAVCQGALGHFKAVGAINDRSKIAPQTPGTWTVAAPHFQHIAQTLRGDHTNLRTLTLQQRVGSGRCAMHYNRHR